MHSKNYTLKGPVSGPSFTPRRAILFDFCLLWIRILLTALGRVWPQICPTQPPAPALQPEPELAAPPPHLALAFGKMWISCWFHFAHLDFTAAELFAPRAGRNIQEESGCQERAEERWGFALHGVGSCPLLRWASPSKCQLPTPSRIYLHRFNEMTARRCCFAGGNSAGHILS